MNSFSTNDQLPIEVCVPALRKALSRGHAVLSAPPGSGKTTRVPLALLEESWLQGRKIVMLEPRRPAARMAAYRMASMLGESVGETVGYQVRFDRRIGPDTRIEVLTEGLLTRRLQRDPELTGVGLLIFDEFHERSLQADLGLALALDVCRGLRDDLRLLVMSATLEEQRIAGLLDAQVVKGDGGLFPVEVFYRPLVRDREQLQAVAAVVREALREQEGDVLVFLPGMREIETVERLLGEMAQADLLRLHGDLGPEQQDRVLLLPPGHRRRVILSTDIAETSLTIEGIGVVIDSGLTRKPVFDANSGLTRLQTRMISRASAEQRAGRAGRLGPGVCYRLWSSERQQSLDPAITPEILQADLSPLVLELAQWGIGDAGAMTWLEPPPAKAWRQAQDLLGALGALDGAGRITAVGGRMAALGLAPRLAHLLVDCGDEAQCRLAARVAAMLSERDPMLRRDGPLPVDIALRVDALTAMQEKRPLPAGFDKRRLAAIDRLCNQLLRQVGTAVAGEPHSLGGLISLAFPDRIAMRRPGGRGRYLLSSGRGAQLAEDDPLVDEPFLAVAHMDAGVREGRIWLAAPITLQELQQLHATRIAHKQQLAWDASRQAVAAREEILLDALVLESRPRPLTAEMPVSTLLLDQVRQHGLDLLDWSDEARQLRSRIRTMKSLDSRGAWPSMDDADLLDGLEEWLVPWLGDISSLDGMRRLDLCRILSARMEWGQQQRLDEWLPTHFCTAGGNRYRIDYDTDGMPVLAVPLQEMYGQQDTPRLAQGRLPLLLHLLSPARRPVQVTQDLAGFWQGSYSEVAKELRGRYPKHHWPDDPANAKPVLLKRALKK